MGIEEVNRGICPLSESELARIKELTEFLFESAYPEQEYYQ
jgi:hypothetical protein